MKTVFEVVSRHTTEEATRPGMEGGKCVAVTLAPVEPSNLPPATASFTIQFEERELGASEPFRIGRRFRLIADEIM